MNVLKEQYELVKHTRELLFQFCETLDTADYTKELEGFGWGSVRNLHVHIAECYQNWLGRFGLRESLLLIEPSQVQSVSDMRGAFKQVDLLVHRFLDEFEGRYNAKVEGTVPWQEDNTELSVLWLFTHTLTHEFHHKGQIVTMGRQLGYIPTDTDLILPEEIVK
ncbi:DinB family protein [Virgibacillus ihumii]|uniref:DinB family protein n=1 Tax=Virgibacillus ihumii TaxID=2686091 RepID=UPI00157C8D09|nr:DinB family protein [Virgibacillus ihumii]